MSSSVQANRLGRDARRVLLGFVATNVGNGVYTLAVGNLLFELTDSVLGYAVVVLSEFAFKLLLQGVTRFDRINARRVCVIADTGRAIILVAAAILLAVGQTFIAIIVATLVINLVKPIYMTASFRLALELNADEQLRRYNVVFTVAKQGGYLVGVAIYGLFLLDIPLAWIVLLNVVSYVTMVICLILVRPSPSASKTEEEHAGNGWTVTWSLIARGRMLTSALLASHDAFLMYLVTLFILQASHETYASQDASLAMLQGAFSVGVAATIFVPFRGAVRTSTGIGRVIPAVLELALVTTAFVTDLYWLALAALALVGFVCTRSASSQMANLMREARKQNAGRVAGLQLLLLSILMIIAMPVMTWLMDYSLASAASVPAVACLAFGVLNLIQHR